MPVRRDEPRERARRRQASVARAARRARIGRPLAPISTAQTLGLADRARLDSIINRALAEFVARRRAVASGPDQAQATAARLELIELFGIIDRLDGLVSRPVAGQFAVIGRPFAGTHTLGDWQSDNAIDLGVPVGTPIIAVSAGIVQGVGGSWNGGADRFDGYHLTLDSLAAPGGPQQFWYGHLSQALVRDGQRVHKGELLGFSGAANGSPHLHLGQRFGDPQQTFGL